jgi:hypothetical protein
MKMKIIHCCLKQDGATVHIVYASLALLRDIFSERIFSRYVQLWRLCDQTSPDFLWQAVKYILQKQIRLSQNTLT